MGHVCILFVMKWPGLGCKGLGLGGFRILLLINCATLGTTVVFRLY